MPAANNGIKLYLNPRRVHILMVFMKLIRAAKIAIYGFLSQADITDAELSTALRWRLLTYQTAGSRDDTSLMLNQLLHGLASGDFSPHSVDTEYYKTIKWPGTGKAF